MRKHRSSRNIKALSTVVATLIILVASVVLGVSVTLYATGVFQARVQEEAIEASNLHLWVNVTTGGGSAAGFVVKNTGARDTGISSITVRGSSVPVADIYFWKGSAAQELEFSSNVTDITASTVNITMYSGKTELFTQASGSVGISPGEEVVIYIDTPGGLGAGDAGATATTAIVAGQANAVTQIGVRSVT